MQTTFKVIRNKDEAYDLSSGTSLWTTISPTYAQLTKIFGKPSHTGDGYKVDAEWVIKLGDGTVFTIYNYKTGTHYLGSAGTPVTKIRDWHIGLHQGRPFASVKVRDFLREVGLMY